VTEDKYRMWDIRFKVGGAFVVIVSALWTLHTYNDARTKEQNSYIFQRQAALYFDAAQTAATIAISKDPQKLAPALERFNELYAGEMVIVEDRRVELAMIAVHNCLPDNAKMCVRPTKNQNNKDIDAKKLELLGQESLYEFSLELAACTRNALQDDREISFGKVQPAKTVCPYD
jgi:hypothetical protein